MSDSDEKNEMVKKELTIELSRLFEEGIIINTGEEVVLTVIDDIKKISG